MSKLIVEVCRVSSIEDHPNAERLKIATVKGWKTCIPYDPTTNKASFEVGELCVYFPPDAVLPSSLIKRMGIENYVSILPQNPDGTRPDGGRIKAARLRGYPSYGAIMKLDPTIDPSWEEGTDVVAHFGITKWEPPPEAVDGDAERRNSKFHTYTNIENFGNYPDIFVDGEEVIFTEKIHGQNARIGIILDTDENGNPFWKVCAGSHGVQRKEFDANGIRSRFWEPVNDKSLALMEHIKNYPIYPEDLYSVLIFGEIYGSGVQDMTYGLNNGVKNFKAFDIAVNGMYLDHDVKSDLFAKFGIEQVPVLYRGPFSKKILEDYTSGPTIMASQEQILNKFKGREGVVITPVKENNVHPILGRKILKSISPDYLARKGATDSH